MLGIQTGTTTAYTSTDASTDASFNAGAHAGTAEMKTTDQEGATTAVEMTITEMETTSSATLPLTSTRR